MKGGGLVAALAAALISGGAPTGHVAAAADNQASTTAVAPLSLVPAPGYHAPTSAVLGTEIVPATDRLIGLGVDTAVTNYADCSGQASVPRSTAAIDRCAPSGLVYFLGHNPGVFSPLMSATVGQQITWFDSSGAPHQLKIISVRNVSRFDGFPSPTAGAAAEFQTCATSDGSIDRILDAAAA